MALRVGECQRLPAGPVWFPPARPGVRGPRCHTMRPVADIVIVIIGYLLGMFPSAQLVGRRTGHDPTVEGSHNPGATNVLRTSGKRAGALVLLLDFCFFLAGRSIFSLGVGTEFIIFPSIYKK